MQPDAARMLHMFKAEPTLLDPAPTENLGAAIERRRRDEVHACLRCGGRAQAAVIADTEAGNRWLDLCYGCLHAVRDANT